MTRFDLAHVTHAPPGNPDGSPQERTVRGRLTLPEGPGPHPVVLIAHGYTTFMDWGFFPEIADRLAAQGVASLRFNFSGSGIGPDLVSPTEPERFARNSYLHELDDLATVRAALDRGDWPLLDPDRVGILGHSRGGAMSLIHAAEHRGYRALVTWAAIDRILQFTPERLAQWRVDGVVDVMHWTARRTWQLDVSTLRAAEQHAERLDVLAACRKVPAPVLVVMGDADAGLAPAVAENLAAAAGERGELCWVPGGDHTFGARHPLRRPLPDTLERVLEATTQHFRRHLVAGG